MNDYTRIVREGAILMAWLTRITDDHEWMYWWTVGTALIERCAREL